jgi:hypothetical protein
MLRALSSNGRCLQIHCLATGLHATVWWLLIFPSTCLGTKLWRYMRECNKVIRIHNVVTRWQKRSVSFSEILTKGKKPLVPIVQRTGWDVNRVSTEEASPLPRSISGFSAYYPSLYWHLSKLMFRGCEEFQLNFRICSSRGYLCSLLVIQNTVTKIRETMRKSRAIYPDVFIRGKRECINFYLRILYFLKSLYFFV